MSTSSTVEKNPGDEAMSRLLAENWWALAIRGVAAILLGLIAIFVPGAAMLSLALFFAAYLLVDGVFGIISAVRAARADQRWGWLLAEGVLDIIVGIIAFLFPVSAVFAFVLVTAAWAFLTGIMMLVSAYKLTRDHGRWWMVLSGVVSILFGVALVIAPLIGAVVLTWWLGGYAIAFGVFMLILAFRLRSRHEQGKLPTGGATAHGV